MTGPRQTPRLLAVMKGVSLPAGEKIGIPPHRNEAPEAYTARLIENFPLLTADNVALYRSLATALSGKEHKHDKRRLEETARILQARVTDPTISLVTRRGISDLIGGDGHHITAFVREFKADQRLPVSHREIFRKNLGTVNLDLTPLLQLGLIEIVQGAGPYTKYNVAEEGMLTELRRRYEDLAPQNFNLQWLGAYHKVRRLLLLKTWEPHPPAVLDVAINFFIHHGQKPGVTELASMLGGDHTQIREAIARRHALGHYVQRPREKLTSCGADLQKLEEALPETLRQMPFTPLDHEHGNTLAHLNKLDIAKVISIEDERLLIVAAVIAGYGSTVSAHRYNYKRALLGISRLWQCFEGCDITDAGAVAAVITAQETITDGLAFDMRLRNYEFLYSWGLAVDVFDDYLKQDLPDAIRNELQAIMPVRPGMGEKIFKRLLTKIRAINERRYRDRMKDLDKCLEDAPSLAFKMMRRRELSQTLRRAIHDKVEAELTRIEDERLIDLPIDIELPSEDGTCHIVVSVRVHSWDHWIGKLASTGKHDCLTQKFNGPYRSAGSEWDDRFETRFAISFVGTVDKNGEAASSPYWIDFQIEKLFSSVRDLNDAEFTRISSKLREYKMSLRTFSMRPAGLAHFSRARGRLAQAARKSLGVILLPLEENDHAEAFAIYSVMMRLDAPIRSGELSQFNLDSGMITEEDEEGDGFAVFTAYRKMQAHLHEFVPSPTTERLIEELLDTTSRRKLGGGAIAPIDRPRSLKKGPEQARFVLSFGNEVLDPSHLTSVTALFLAGIINVRPHDFKYLWCRLQLLAGKDYVELQREQGHSSILTTFIYTPIVESDRKSSRLLRHRYLEEREAHQTTVQL